MQSNNNQEIATPRCAGLAMTETRMSERQYCVYILTNKNHTVFYAGVTNNLLRRMMEHRSKEGSKFTAKYNVDKLVYFECGNSVEEAIL